MHLILQLLAGFAALYIAISAFDKWGFAWGFVWIALLGVLGVLGALAEVLP